MTSPANGAIDQMPNTLLDWSAVSGATSYEVQIDTNLLFTTPISYISTVTAKNAVELFFGTTYYWRVRAISATETSAWSTVRNFITIAKIANLTFPNNGAINVHPKDDLKWTAITGLTNYDYEIDTTNTFSSGILIHGSVSATTAQYTTNNLLYGTKYYWRARARHSMDTSIWTAERNFNTIDSLNLSSPANNAVNQSIIPQLSWITINGSFKYEIQVDLTNLFNTPSLSSSIVNAVLSGANQSISWDTLNFGLDYYWRVRSINLNDTSKWSPVRKFQTINKVNMTYPANGAIGVETNPKFKWDAVSGITGYTLTWSKFPNFAAATNIIVPSNQNYCTVNNLPLDTIYWKVVAKTNSDTSSFNSFSFKTSGVGIETTTLNSSNIKVYPNPSKGKFVLRIETSNSLNIDLSILNLVGQQVYSEAIVINGIFSKELNLTNLPKGIYLLKCEEGKSINIQKLIIQ